MRNKWLHLFLLTLLCGLISCGGSGVITSGGVGSGGSGVAVGPVTGYGSIIVGGLSYDDSDSATVEQNASGTMRSAQTQLGDQVLVTLDANNKVQTIEVLPSFIGPVSRNYNDSTGLLEVLGQPVRIAEVTDQNDTTTVVQGYDLTGDTSGHPQTNDLVKVHGVWLNEGDADTPQYVLQATRIEKINSNLSPTAFLLSGHIIAPQNEAQSTIVRINRQTGFTLQLSNLSPSTRQRLLPNTGIHFWVDSSQWDSLNQVWQQQPIMVLRAKPTIPEAQAGQRLLLSGRVDSVDTASRDIMVHGTRYTVPSNAVLPSQGQSVQLELIGDEASTWQARDMQARHDNRNDDQTNDQDNLGAQVRLRGVTANPDWTRNRPFDFTLRGVTVQINATTQLTGCNGIAVNTQVQIQMLALRPARDRPRLTAKQVTCTPA